MAISLKNVDSRVRILETYAPTKVKELIGDSNKIYVTSKINKTLTDESIRTAKWAFVDWTIDDDCRGKTYRSVVLPLRLMRTPKVFSVSDHASDGYQGLQFSLNEDSLTIQQHNLWPIADSKVWIRYLAVFKYYLNTVKGWVI